MHLCELRGSYRHIDLARDIFLVHTCELDRSHDFACDGLADTFVSLSNDSFRSSLLLLSIGLMID